MRGHDDTPDRERVGTLLLLPAGRDRIKAGQS
jgi:hypothetical protein